VLLICLPSFGATTNLVIKVGSKILSVNGKQYTLPQPAITNKSGVMVPVEVLSKGMGASIVRKGDTITITPKEVPEVELITDKDHGFKKLQSMFDRSTTSIYISMQTIVNEKLIEKITCSKYPERKVYIILDEDNNLTESKELKKLRNSKNVFCKLMSKYKVSGMRTQAYCYCKRIAIFDEKEIFTGSSNWLDLPFSSTTDEQNFIIKSKVIAGQAKTEFMKDWDSIKLR
jgi:HKD family nuclease